MSKRYPPMKYVMAACLQCVVVGFVYGICVLLTYFPMGPLVALTARRGESPHGEEPTAHSDKYIAQGSSGRWEYWTSPLRWIRDWTNYEDGLLGEPTGKHSARVKGKERTFWNIYGWILRNPYNYGKRTRPFFACPVNECDIQWWGTGDVSDKGPIVSGWYFIRAVHKETGKVYYGYRFVIDNSYNEGPRLRLAKLSLLISNLFTKEKRNVNETVYNAVFGFKIKPSHSYTVQDSDDLDKAFTARIQFASKPD